MKDTWQIDRIALPLAGITIALMVLALILWATGCGSIHDYNERASREEYARARAGCYETAGFWGDGFKKCMREKGWRE